MFVSHLVSTHGIQYCMTGNNRKYSFNERSEIEIPDNVIVIKNCINNVSLYSYEIELKMWKFATDVIHRDLNDISKIYDIDKNINKYIEEVTSSIGGDNSICVYDRICNDLNFYEETDQRFVNGIFILPVSVTYKSSPYNQQYDLKFESNTTSDRQVIESFLVPNKNQLYKFSIKDNQEIQKPTQRIESLLQLLNYAAKIKDKFHIIILSTCTSGSITEKTDPRANKKKFRNKVSNFILRQINTNCVAYMQARSVSATATDNNCSMIKLGQLFDSSKHDVHLLVDSVGFDSAIPTQGTIKINNFDEPFIVINYNYLLQFHYNDVLEIQYNNTTRDYEIKVNGVMKYTPKFIIQKHQDKENMISLLIFERKNYYLYSISYAIRNNIIHTGIIYTYQFTMNGGKLLMSFGNNKKKYHVRVSETNKPYIVRNRKHIELVRS